MRARVVIPASNGAMERNRVLRALIRLMAILSSFCYTSVGVISRKLGAKMPNISIIFKNAMSLDVHDRAALAEKLLASLEQLSDTEAECIWADEAQKRRGEYRAGRSKAVPAQAIRRKVEKLFR